MRKQNPVLIISPRKKTASNTQVFDERSIAFEFSNHERNVLMLWTIFVILLVLWLLGFSFHVAGSLIHILLVIAVVVLVINLISGRRAL